MWIKGKKTAYDEYLTVGQLDYLHERYRALDRMLERKFYKLDDSFGYSLDWSRKSEALYITIEHDDPGYLADSATLSVRNHGIYDSDSQSDHYIWFAEFRTWIDARKKIIEWVNKQITELGK